MTAEDTFKEYAARWIKNDVTNVVPIIGSGVNMQAATLEGKKQLLNWDTLIKEIISEFGILDSELPTSFIRKWETVLRIVAIHTRGYQPYVTEKNLQKKVQGILHNFEEDSKDYGLYKSILDVGFKDIISLNFDRSLSLAGNAKSIKSLSDQKSKDAVPLYRHSQIKNSSATRIWYPHGDTKRSDTIKLGVRKYGIYINWIESLRGSYMNRWLAADNSYCSRHIRDWIPPNEWDQIVRTQTITTPNWVDIFKSAPLLFIGCSLLPDEWPLWYLLNQRARQTAFLDQKGSPDYRPETIVLSAGSQKPQHLSNSPEYIVNIHFETYDKMWKTLLDFFESNQI